MVLNKRNGQIMVSTEKKETWSELMVYHIHIHFEDAKRTSHRMECIASIVNVFCPSVRFDFFSSLTLSPQSIRNRFHIVFLRHNHINNRYFGWEKKLNSLIRILGLNCFCVYRTCSTPSSSSSTTHSDWWWNFFVGQKTERKKLAI